MSYTPEGFLDAALLRRLAGEQPFTRGEECFAEGRVRQLHASADRVVLLADGRVAGEVDRPDIASVTEALQKVAADR